MSKKISFVAILLCLCLTLGACAGKQENKKNNNTASDGKNDTALVGTWQLGIDPDRAVAAALEGEDGEDKALLEKMDRKQFGEALNELYGCAEVTFGADQTVKYKFDTKRAEEPIGKLVECFTAAIGNLSDSEIEKATNGNETAQKVLAALGEVGDKAGELFDGIKEKAEDTDAFKTISGAMKSAASGIFQKLGDKMQKQFDEHSEMQYTFANKQLTLTNEKGEATVLKLHAIGNGWYVDEVSGETEEDADAFVKGITFTKVK